MNVKSFGLQNIFGEINVDILLLRKIPSCIPNEVLINWGFSLY